MKVFMLAGVSGLFFIGGNAMAEGKTCQTVAEIAAHFKPMSGDEYERPIKGEFCFHKVVDPSVGLASGEAIAVDRQLAPNLEVAFLDVRKPFYEAQAACASLGADWHAPLSEADGECGADPRATDSSSSLQAMGDYFKESVPWRTGSFFWSSSSVLPSCSITRGPYAWHVTLWHGYSSYGYGNKNPGAINRVMCVRS